MPLLSIRKYAETRAGVSHTAVRKWIAAGMPMVNGQVDPDAADAWRAANLVQQSALREVAKAPASETRPVSAPVVSPSPAVEPAPVPEAQPSPLTQARTQREELRAQRELIRLEQDRGELVSAREVEATWAALVVATQNALLNVAEKVSGRVSRSRDESECRSIVDREIREALAALSRQLVELAAA